ncbi:MAG: accessory Sec system protein Asp1 [Lachnospiraceae bacterium]|nr:accessory Sec system protein Asp1 [Lachnospiraceae bacterium]
MLHFISSWYKEDNWSESEQVWYIRRMHTEFDDTVKQIQLFHRNKIYEYRILLLHFAPNFRHFLHRQGVFHAPYWSVFDAIAQVRRRKAVVLSFHNLNWPPSIEFVYNPYNVQAYLSGEKYAKVGFGEDGNPIQVDLYRHNSVIRRNIYDDRGFVAASVVFNNGLKHYQDYLLENGTWALRHFYDDGHVEVNPKCGSYLISSNGRDELIPYKKEVYASMDEIIAEVLLSYVVRLSDEDIFCVAMHRRHEEILSKCLKGKKTVLSFFGDRYDIASCDGSSGLIRESGCIIVDSKANLKRIRSKQGFRNKEIINITPYDSRVDFGISQQMSVHKIMVPVDNMDLKSLESLIIALATYLDRNDNSEIHLFTRNEGAELAKEYLKTTESVLRDAFFEPGWAVKEEATELAVNENIDIAEESKNVPIRFFVDQCVDELSVSRFMREQRVMVDMREHSDLYLQISCISMGIPQIVRESSEYVTHEGNGLIIPDMRTLPDALDYFLNGLAHWNDALIYSYELGRQYTTDVLMKKWKGVIERLE